MTAGFGVTPRAAVPEDESARDAPPSAASSPGDVERAPDADEPAPPLEARAPTDPAPDDEAADDDEAPDDEAPADEPPDDKAPVEADVPAAMSADETVVVELPAQDLVEDPAQDPVEDPVEDPAEHRTEGTSETTVESAPLDPTVRDAPPEDAPTNDEPTMTVSYERPYVDSPSAPTLSPFPRFSPPPYDPALAEASTPAHASLPKQPAVQDTEPADVPAVPSDRAPDGYATGGVPILPIEGGWDAVYRRRRRQTMTFVAGLAVVLIVGFVAWLTYSGVVPWPFGGKVDAAQSLCNHTQPLPPKKIVLRVYNGTSRRGLASQVSVQLKAFGFTVKETGNDPLETRLRTPVELRHGENGDVAAASTSAYLTGKARMVQDDRRDESVDVVLGPGFTRVHTRSEVTKALAGVTASLPLTCPPGVTPPVSPTPSPKGTVKPTRKR
jgi:hypothetical protein